MDHLHGMDTNELMQVPNMNIGTNTMKIDELQQTQPMIKATPFPFIAGFTSLNSLDKSQTLAGLQSMPPIIATDSNNNNMLHPQKFNINSINTMNAGSMSSMGSIPVEPS